MANHKNTKKAARSSQVKRLRNKYYAKTTRNLIRDLRATTAKKDAEALLPKVTAEIDKCVKRNIFHKNKAANLKSSLTKLVSAL